MSTNLETLSSALECLPWSQVQLSDLAVRAEGCGYRIDYSPLVWSRQDEQHAYRTVKKHLESHGWTLSNLGGYLFAR